MSDQTAIRVGKARGTERHLGNSLVRAKNFFFDRAVVRETLTGATYSALLRTSAYIRRVAINSMKRGNIRKKGKKAGQQIHSKPNKPPKYWSGLIRQFLFFVYDTRSKSVVIGPQKLGSKDTTVSDLESGSIAKNLAKRPYMLPAFEKGKKRLNANIARAGFKRAMKGATV